MLKRFSGKRLHLPPLAIGMGIYLPMEADLLIPFGAVLGWFYNRWAMSSRSPAFAERMGVLMATGLIVGESLMGVVYAAAVAGAEKAGSADSANVLALIAALFVGDGRQPGRLLGWRSPGFICGPRPGPRTRPRRTTTRVVDRKRPTASGQALRGAARPAPGLGAVLGLADQLDDRAVDRRVRAEPLGQPHQLAVEIIDLGLAARGEVVGHRRARLGVDLPALEEEVVEQPVGRADHQRQQARRRPAPTLAGSMPARLKQAQPLAHARRRRRGGSRAACSSSSRVRPDSALTALLRLMSNLPQARPSMSLGQLAAPPGRRRRASASARVSAPVLGAQIARDAFMETALAQIGDVVRHHPARDLGSGRRARASSTSTLLMPFWKLMTSAPSLRMLGDVARRLRGRAAFHAERDDLGIAERGRDAGDNRPRRELRAASRE